MQKVIAAFITPCIVFIWYFIYTLFIYQGFSFNGFFDLLDSLFSTFFVTYIYALPVYLLIGVPFSLVIEHLGKGVRWVNYCLAGIVGGFIIIIMSGNSINEFTVELVLLYILMGYSFYISLKLVEIKDKKLQKQK